MKVYSSKFAKGINGSELIDTKKNDVVVTGGITVQKRDGRLVSYNGVKIQNAVAKALNATKEIDQRRIPMMASIVEMMVREEILNKILVKDRKAISVETIQDLVENTMIRLAMPETVRAYILYRNQHKKVREANRALLDVKKTMEGYIGEEKDWRVKENSTVSLSLGGLILSNSGTLTANYWLSEIYDEEIANAHRSAAMHIHDLSMFSGYCAGWSLKQLLVEGLGGVEGRITSAPAKHLSTLCNQMVNFLGIMQNEWAGAQAFSSFDTYLAPFVRTDNLNYKQVKQCVQSFVYGVNTPSRWGCVPITTKIATPDGWKSCDELNIGDVIYTWVDGVLHEARLKHLIRHDNDYGVLHCYKGKGYQQIVTPEHRCIVESGASRGSYLIKQSMDIFKKRKDLRMPASFEDVDVAVTTELSDDEVILAAMLYTDGHVEDDEISIYKSSRRDTGLIEDVLNRLCISYSKSEKHTSDDNVYYQYRIKACHYDTIRQLITSKTSIDEKFLHMSHEQSRLFVETWAQFDGSINGRIMCQYDSDEIRNKLEIIMLRAGYMSHKWSRKKDKDKNPTNYLYADTKSSVVILEQEEIPYAGPVWCPNTDDGTAIYKDEDGNIFISGNCQAPFTNITLDWVVPEDMKNLPAIVGGKNMDFTYGDCKKEMDMINRAFIEIMIEGDANGRGFQYPIPTYSITKDFDWSDTENNRLLFEMAAKYGTPYFSNYINSDMEPSDVRSMCCRLRLDLRELRKKSGGFFGSGESTGSVGVVTLNLPRLAYLAENEKEFYDSLDHLMDIAARSLDTKRKVITKMMDEGLYPYTKKYLGGFDNHFSTIGLVGMNEAARNAKWLRTNLTTPEGQQFAKDVLNHMRDRLSDYQEQYGALFNLEATPAESTSFRLAKHDVEKYPDIITAAEKGETPFYTNSSHLPVGYTDDVFDALDLQDDLQTLYTSGTVFHAFLGERLPDWKAAATLVREIAENYKLPYYTLSPTYSVCPEHGYIAGEHEKCPKCGKETEVYSRITGYYRPLKNWNDGKVQEFQKRKEYDVSSIFEENTQNIVPEKSSEEGFPNASAANEACCANGSCSIPTTAPVKEEVGEFTFDIPMLVTTPTCPNCKMAKGFLDRAGKQYLWVDVTKHPEIAAKYNIKAAPTLIVPTKDGVQIITNVSNILDWIKN